jgi:hypothetical protein
MGVKGTHMRKFSPLQIVLMVVVGLPSIAVIAFFALMITQMEMHNAARQQDQSRPQNYTSCPHGFQSGHDGWCYRY